MKLASADEACTRPVRTIDPASAHCVAEAAGTDSVDTLAKRLAALLPLLRTSRVSSPWLTATEAAAYLRRSTSRVCKLTSTRELPCHRDGRRVLYHRDEAAGVLERGLTVSCAVGGGSGYTDSPILKAIAIKDGGQVGQVTVGPRDGDRMLTAGGVDVNARYVFTRGDCAELALARHDHSGWPIVAAGSWGDDGSFAPGTQFGMPTPDDRSVGRRLKERLRELEERE